MHANDEEVVLSAGLTCFAFTNVVFALAHKSSKYEGVFSLLVLGLFGEKRNPSILQMRYD